MKQLFVITLFVLLPVFSFSQELYADVSITFDKVKGSNNQIYTTLKKDLKDFINNTRWTDKNLSMAERIKCTIAINIEEKPSSDQFKGTIAIRAGRPVFNSGYITPILNFQDTNFTFNYTESERLIFNENRFSGKNLSDVICYYIYMILGYDADTFSNKGGENYFLKAKKIANNSINQGYNGWNSFDGPKTRESMVSNILSGKANTLRGITYQYHRLGLDNMATNEQKAKNTIASSLLKLSAYSNDFQFYPLDIFLTSKKDEISNIFSAGLPTTDVNIVELKTLLQNINPTNSKDYWDKIKN